MLTPISGQACSMYEHGDYHILCSSSCGFDLSRNPVERFNFWDHNWAMPNYALLQSIWCQSMYCVNGSGNGEYADSYYDRYTAILNEWLSG